eukprot:2350236-Prymnesium_polylepis.1
MHTHAGNTSRETRRGAHVVLQEWVASRTSVLSRRCSAAGMVPLHLGALLSRRQGPLAPGRAPQLEAPR